MKILEVNTEMLLFHLKLHAHIQTVEFIKKKAWTSNVFNLTIETKFKEWLKQNSTFSTFKVENSSTTTRPIRINDFDFRDKTLTS